MRYDAMKEVYEEIIIVGQPAMFSSMRIDRNTVPKGLYLYEVRHDDFDWVEPAQIAKGILVNHFGTVITHKEINLPEDGYLDLNEEDFSYVDSDMKRLKDYMDKYMPKQKSNKEQER